MTSHRQAVVIGGGVGGCSVAYWLTRLGWSDVLLVERAELTSGSTFHSAGLVGQLRGSLPLTKMMMSSVELYRRLGDEVGLESGWREVSSLRLASSAEQLEELRRQAAWAESFGLPFELISAAAARDLFPPLDVGGVLGAAHLPTDGFVDPSQLTLALAKGARLGGAEVRTGTAVTSIDVVNGRVLGVELEAHDFSDRDGSTSEYVEADAVINAAGIYAHDVGLLAGVHVPLVPMAHQYAITRPAGLPTDMPTLRDPSLLVYFRGESGGLVAGGYERDPKPWGLAGIPHDFNNQLLDEDWDRFAPLFENASRRVPLLADAEIVRLVNGPEAFTPDGEFILGETEVRGFFVAAGFCAHGIAGAGGMGKLLAEWVVDGRPSLDAWHMDGRRFGEQYRSRLYTLGRATEVYATYYDVKYPGQERQAGRPLRRSPAYERLVGLGAAFGEKAGWERANWFASNDRAGDEAARPGGWAGRHWAPAIAAEHRACRERAALFDQTSFAKLEISGPGAAAGLERICANRVDRSPGRVVYTQLLNERGGIEADLTVTRLAEERFRVVTGTAFALHDLAWIKGHLPAGNEIRVDDVTSQHACLCLWGPLAREILQPLTEVDLGTESFAYLTARAISVGPVPCLAARVTFVGELGWELYCPTEFGATLWDLLWQAGRPHGLLPGGYRAIDSLRLEKGYRVWGSDITSADTPFESGLSGTVALSKEEFIGKTALEGAGPPRRRLACVVLDDPRAVVLGEEPVRIDGHTVGRVTSGGFGYTVGRSIAYGYVPAEECRPGRRVEINLFGELKEGEITPEPLYDPEGARIRA